jgi:hypothetical protein
MKDSTKILIASIIIFACSIGFFIGAFAFNGSSSCASKAVTCSSKHGFCDFKAGDCCKKKMDCCKRHGGEFRGDKFHHGPNFHGEPPHGPHFKGKDFDKKFDKKFDFKKGEAFMDSVLQVTHEQKAALEQQRKATDSTFKILRKQKKEAEKSLRDALDANDDKKIATAKAEILKAQEALLNHRIQGVKAFNKILSKEQLEKFKAMQFEHKKHDKHHKGEYSPEHDNGQPRD